MPPRSAYGRYRCRHGKVDNGYKCKECRGAGICGCGNVREHCPTCNPALLCSRSGFTKRACGCCGADFSCGKDMCKDHGYVKSKCPRCQGRLKGGVSYPSWPRLGITKKRKAEAKGEAEAEALSPRELSFDADQFFAQGTASHAQAEPIMCEAVQCLEDDE